MRGVSGVERQSGSLEWRYSSRAGDVVVAIAEDGCGDCDGVAEDSLCRVAAAVDLRLNFFDNDAFAAFNRFHITQIFRCNVTIPWYSPVHFTCIIHLKLKGLPLGRCILPADVC